MHKTKQQKMNFITFGGSVCILGILLTFIGLLINKYIGYTGLGLQGLGGIAIFSDTMEERKGEKTFELLAVIEYYQVIMKGGK